MHSWLLRRTAKRLQLDKLYDTLGTLRSPFRGVYESWEEASQAIPEDRKVGFNHADVAGMYTNYMEELRLSDYAALFWMKSAIGTSSSVFDLGGNIGVSCYAFEEHLQYPNHLRWIVCDLPKITQFGRELARVRGMSRLEFTEDYLQANGTDILLTAGTLQCMDVELSTILGSLSKKPRHILINRVPLCEGSDFFTVRDLPPIMLVYRVSNRKSFIQSIEANGYKLMDFWKISEPDCGSCVIPFHPEKAIRNYSGLYFRAV